MPRYKMTLEAREYVDVWVDAQSIEEARDKYAAGDCEEERRDWETIGIHADFEIDGDDDWSDAEGAKEYQYYLVLFERPIYEDEYGRSKVLDLQLAFFVERDGARVWKNRNHEEIGVGEDGISAWKPMRIAKIPKWKDKNDEEC